MKARVSTRTGELSLAHVEEQLLARWPETKIDPSLDRIALLLSLLGEPQAAYRAVHLTGTNGKTSTARMVDALLAESGIRTGRLTSPHLTSLRERISLDRQPIAVSDFLAAYAVVSEQAIRADAVSEHPLSYFEMTVAMAYRAFADHGVEVAVVEVGMGGRWDATNTIDAEAATILPIDLDHRDYLGPTASAIAMEKAGIIKPGAVAVSAQQSQDVAAVLRAQADEMGARLVVQDRDFSVTRRAVDAGQVISVRGLAGTYDEVPLSLLGPHQADNAAIAIATTEALLGRALDLESVRSALSRVASPGRFELRPGNPPVILDAAHNPHGARSLVSSLAELGPGRTYAVLAVMADKDYGELLRQLEPVVDAVVCTRNSSPRCLPGPLLATAAREVFGAEQVQVAADVATAVEAARSLAACVPGEPADSRVLVTGSVVTVGDARQVLEPVTPTGLPALI
jgi:dihydrofolate synthase/folylpolyglutamate synthase